MFEDDVLEEGDGVSVFSDLLDLFSGSIRDTRVGHGVSMVPIGLGLNEDGAMFHGICLGKGHACLHVEDIMAFQLDTWDVWEPLMEVWEG